MAQASLPPPPPTAPEPAPLASPFRPSRFVIAGAFGACVLGVGLGLWARPTSPALARIAAAEPAPPTLQVVVDDRPAPAGPLLEVLPDDVAATDRTHAVARLIPVEPLTARAAGLVRVDAVVAPAPPRSVAPAAKAAPAPQKLIVPPRAPPAKAVETPKAKPSPVTRVAQAEPRPPKAKPEKTVKLARAEPKSKARAEAKPAKSAKAAPQKVIAKAKPTVSRKTPIEQAEAKPRPAKAKVIKVAAKPQKAKVQQAKVQQPKVQKAKLEKTKAEKAKVERAPKAKPALTKTKVAKAPPPKARTQVARAAAPKAVPAAPRRVVPRGEGPLRVARAERCAAADPGEALVCADRRLAARDRQLQQAYRDAEAAGVPASALRRQQTRWVQARAAAAREAPWAVEDVYVARISELHDLSRDAQEN
jgi:hypothetical protein